MTADNENATPLVLQIHIPCNRLVQLPVCTQSAPYTILESRSIALSISFGLCELYMPFSEFSSMRKATIQ
jgi:hypothetical protein